ncbi:Cell death protease [Coemansia thaxteri]|uniref:Pheromone-processing carboxypeptidase KEX1 n=1 Tax=Coemansia thaxteri TaxID=2663907 RepID=A0A9W8BAE0_9FUNG|nr:Cell death protease [Coemansia thaxteri]KAJ2007768.1 Cell death protease [Coemansia thaxteri]KAJ2469986.1 Cell death protease [Coemansia sp. RSA 2322]KAJ2486804.1 Cell death protease [Coemansia sp. RSA 2320]
MLRARDEASTANATAPALPSRSKLAVSRIPLQDGPEFSDLEQYAGQLPVRSEKDLMFFWLVTNTTNAYNKDKLIIWLNGGPGCTSLDGVFLENGPYRFDGANRLVFRDSSLSQQFDVLYIDQPFGTGFSMTATDSYAKTFKEASQTLVDFLGNFYSVFPEFRHRQLYLAGESEAGTYIPYLADALVKSSPPDQPDRVNVAGLMIGNGWIDPYPMYMSYVEVLRRHDLLSANVQSRMLKLMDQCAREYKRAPQPVHTDICERIPQVFLSEGGPSPGTCYNMYDLRLTDTQPSCGMNWPPEINMFTTYLNRKDVQKAINVGPAPSVWTECSDLPNQKLKHDDSPPASNMLKTLLDEHAIPVLLFVGHQDYLCNFVGTEWTIGNMTWAGATGFSPEAVQSEWKIDGHVVGRIESDRGLTYALIYNASHMVGVDRPREILDVFTAFTNASSANLRFTSTFRSQDETSLPPVLAPVPAPTNSELGKWLGLAFLLAIVLSFSLCFMRRQKLFAWWTRRNRDYQGHLQNLDAGSLAVGNSVRRHGYERMQEEELDDAFIMSEFSFAKNLPTAAHRTIDVEGLLLDDDSASSPDEDLASTVRDSRHPSRDHSPSTRT